MANGSSLHSSILIITRNFPPLTGGMEKLLYHVYHEIAKIMPCHVVGPKGCKNFTGNLESAIEIPVKYFFIFLALSLVKSFIHCMREKPSVIIGGSGAVAPVVILLSFMFRTKSVIMVHGLDLIADNYVFQKAFLPFIRKADYLIANSSNTKLLAIQKGVSPHKIQIIYPGTELPDTAEHYLPVHERLRNKYNLEHADILLSVGRLIPRKGLVEFVENSFPDILKECPETRLVVIGGVPENALNKQESVAGKLRAAITKLRLEHKILLLGSVSDSVVNNAYHESDLFIFPLLELSGDVEGFGMVALEAASHGLPVFAFKVGGVKDAIADLETGFLIPPGAYDLLTNYIVEYFRSGKKTISAAACIEHAGKYSWEKFGEHLRNFLATIL